MKKKVKRKAASRAMSKKKKVKKAPTKAALSRKPVPKKKSPAKKQKPTRAAMVAKTIPDPTKTSFVIQSAGAFLTEGGNFTPDATLAIIFASKELAQAEIDGALVLAEAESLLHGATIIPTKNVLKPSYSFDFVNGCYMLSVDIRTKDDETATPFAKAKALVAKWLKDETKEYVKRSAAFKKAWG